MNELIQAGAFLVDVRTPEEFESGHVQASVNIPLDQVAERLDEFEGKDHIIVFCRSGNRSAMAKAILAQNGFANVTNGGTWEDVKQFID
ncbi:MAG: rhodanese-like domain-containing protein [Schleiferiaceae bacterium]